MFAIPLLLSLSVHPAYAQGAPVKDAAPQGWHWAALPTPNYSSTYGIGYGAYFAEVNYGHGDLGKDPYKAKIAVQAYFTTGSYQDHYVKLDFPGILGSKFRWDFQAGVTHWPTASWYGWGNDTARETGSVACTPKNTDVGSANGEIAPCYYNYGQVYNFKVITNLRREISGPWSAFVNYYLRDYNLSIYPDSLLAAAGTTVAGVDGGFYTRLGVGAMYDTRDQEPSPTSGMFAEASVRGGVNLSDPGQRVVAVNLTDKRWVGFGARKRLVLASREIVDMKWGNEPFFMSSTIGGSEDLTVGTSVLLRSFPYSRFNGDGAAFWTPEVRWTYATAHIGKNTLDFVAGPYVDLGRVWLWDAARVGATADDPLNLHYGYGLGTRFIWDTNMVVRLDFGFAQDKVLDPVTNKISGTRDFGLYLVFDHPY